MKMRNEYPTQEDVLRQLFKFFNHFMLLLWRLGLGSWVNFSPQVSGRIMVITHRGRMTGRKLRTPANYAILNGDIYCTAGFGKKSDWYRNILASPEVEVWLPDGWWSGIAEEVVDPVHRIPILRQVLIGSGFAARMAGINPYLYSDKELDQTTFNYRLIRIRNLEPCTGPGGPGDLAWVWPLATMILLPIAIFKRKNKSN